MGRAYTRSPTDLDGVTCHLDAYRRRQGAPRGSGGRAVAAARSAMMRPASAPGFLEVLEVVTATALSRVGAETLSAP